MNKLSIETLFFLRSGRAILRDINLDARPGQLTALIGPNGAGKSTLLKVAAAELRPQRGHCHIGPFDIHRTDSARLARQRAVLPQHISTGFPLIVADVLALGRAPWRRHAPPHRNRQAIEEAAEATGVQPLMQRDYRHLSGGEQQRVQLARVLAQIWDVHWDNEPRYLLLDEPTASLDIGYQQQLLTTIAQVLRQGIGVLAVLHDLNLAAAFADHVYLMHRGRIQANGPPTDVLCKKHINTAYATTLDIKRDVETGRPFVLPGMLGATL